MLWTLVIVVLVFWLLGLMVNIGGSFIHLILAGGAVLLVGQLLASRFRMPV